MEDITKIKLMTLIDKLIEEKLLKDINFIRFSFYEVRVKEKVTNEEEIEFIKLAKIKLNNMGYKVYLQDQQFIYNNAKMRVQPNELLIAIKEK